MVGGRRGRKKEKESGRGRRGNKCIHKETMNMKLKKFVY